MKTNISTVLGFIFFIIGGIFSHPIITFVFMLSVISWYLAGIYTEREMRD